MTTSNKREEECGKSFIILNKQPCVMQKWLLKTGTVTPTLLRALSIQLSVKFSTISEWKIRIKMPNKGSHRNTIHTLTGTGSTALVAAVPYPGKATQISHKGQWSNIIYIYKHNLLHLSAFSISSSVSNGHDLLGRFCLDPPISCCYCCVSACEANVGFVWILQSCCVTMLLACTSNMRFVWILQSC